MKWNPCQCIHVSVQIECICKCYPDATFRVVCRINSRGWINNNGDDDDTDDDDTAVGDDNDDDNDNNEW